ncbi:hypothetical protein [Mesorhizobium sp. M1E.F.Ca.ET.041.01.1.1]|uniref:hypothetical protein n=1 Tax=Mesorhizobium sp. M1E.F.Ca.ET.041.01.1.1 TaxID=2496759 RepID=UPI000FCA2DE7|nr:hypothetical protein [Mesorhizobium sp. M1E.F.Ca.ET.041.01.1.1]RUW32295.1 hypothetical protein EOA38_15815 [Mesorhizobium sp. M1E.F.Ca.ET.041.01.1.1]RWD82217.1 MAG: hypothetical protein EOS38_27420 [Mesorhizobium sp.]
MELYGRSKALLTSPYLYVAAAIAGGLFPIWLAESGGSKTWPQLAIDILPSMIGFSMGGMAIMLAFSNAKIFKTIAEDGDPKSYFMTIIANFFHFILAQTLGMIIALFASAYPNNILSFFGFWALVYAMLVGVATAGQLLMTAQIFNATASIIKDDDNG